MIFMSVLIPRDIALIDFDNSLMIFMSWLMKFTSALIPLMSRLMQFMRALIAPDIALMKFMSVLIRRDIAVLGSAVGASADARFTMSTGRGV